MNNESHDPEDEGKKTIPPSPAQPDSDAFPAEKDVSTPPPGSDQDDDEE